MEKPRSLPETTAYHPGGGPELGSLLTSLGAGLTLLLEKAMAESLGEAPLPLPREGQAFSQALPGKIGRFSVLGELGRGGIGVVYRVHDPELGRELALKVLQEPFRGSTEACQRFVEECQIGGQLQHPCIVPIHEMGVLPGPIPYFTMKLVKGKTLAALLGARRSPQEDRQAMLSVFEHAAQALAYAHSRGVIHRDLKPSNIMVGAFGEVQVMDWGLAKVVANGGIHDERRARKSHVQASTVSVVCTGRDQGAALSRAGSVMGTPSYMPPEQARGRIHELDERSDVFGLGAILCEVLVGRPPHCGATSDDVWRRAQAGDITEATDLLHASDADPSLVALVEECLQPEPRHRPRDAAGVVRVLRQHFDTMDRKALAAQAEAAAATVHARGARRARRLTASMVAALLLALAAGACGFFYVENTRAEQAAAAVQAIERALAEVEAYSTEASQSGARSASLWDGALESARNAEVLAARTGSRRHAEAAAARRLEIERDRSAAADEAARLERERRAAERLLDIRLRHAHARRDEAAALAAEYGAAFAEIGIDPRRSDARERIAASSIASDLVRALDEWAAALRQGPGPARSAWEPVQRAALACSVDPVAERTRQALLDGKSEEITGLARSIIGQPVLPHDAIELMTTRAEAGASGSGQAAQLPAPDRATAAALDLLLAALGELRESELARELGRKAHVYYPADFWLHHRLGATLERIGAAGEALGHLAAVNAARPDLPHTWVDMARLHAGDEAWDEAIAPLHRALELAEADAAARELLAKALRRTLDFDGAAAEYRRLIAGHPGRADLRAFLGESLLTGAGFLAGEAAVRSLDEAISAYGEAAALAPLDGGVLEGFVEALARAGRPFEAAGVARRLLESTQDPARAHMLVGRSLLDGELAAEAAAALEACAARQGSSLEPHLLLALARARQGDETAFLAAMEAALNRAPVVEPIQREEMKRLPPEILERERVRDERRLQARWREAERHLDRVAAGGRGGVSVNALLARVKLHRRDLAASARGFETALAENPDAVEALSGLALVRQIEARRRPEARGELLQRSLDLLERAERATPDSPLLLGQRAVLLDDLGRTAEAVALLEEAVEQDPGQPAVQLNLGWALFKAARIAGAGAAADAALHLDPALTPAHRLLGLIGFQQSRPRSVRSHLRRALELDPGLASAWSNLGLLDNHAGRLEESRRAIEHALDLEPEHSWFQANLANTLEKLGRWEEAARLSESAAAQPGCLAEAHSALMRLRRALGQPCAGLAALSRWIESDRAAGRTLGAADLHEIRSFLEPREDFEPCRELDELRRIVLDAAAAAPSDLFLAQLFLDLWLLAPPAPDPTVVELARKVAAETGGSDQRALETLARVLQVCGLTADAVATLEELDRREPLRGGNRRRLASWRAELLPDLPTFGSVDALLESGDVLLDQGARVRYFPGLKAPPGGMAWVEPGHDDSAWGETEQPCGYAEGDVVLPLEPLAGRAASLYVRARFHLPSLRGVHGIRLAYRAADGVAIWWNGTEAARLAAGAPGSPLAHDTHAGERQGEMDRWESVDLDRGLVREGVNVLAFHVLDRPSASSGLYLELKVQTLRTPARHRESLDAFLVVARDPAAVARASYLEGRILEAEGKPADAAVAFERALTGAGEAMQPFARLLACWIAVGGKEAGQAAFRSRTASVAVPRELARSRPAPEGLLRPDGGIEVPGPRPALAAPPYVSLHPGVDHAASVWEVWPESEAVRRLPLYRHFSTRSLDRLELPAGLLAPATRYRWRVAYSEPGGRHSRFSAEASFVTSSFPWRLHRFHLTPRLHRDVVANPGDDENDPWDQAGQLWTVAGWTGAGHDRSVRGIPADGRIGVHQLADLSGQNCLEIERGEPAEVRFIAPEARLDCLRFLVGAGGDEAELTLRLEYAGGPAVETRLPCPDWTRTPWNFRVNEAHVVCLLQGLDTLHAGRNARGDGARQLFEVIVPLAPGRDLAAVVLASRPEDFVSPSSRVHLLSIVGVSCE